jgi:hypothetical protein
VSEPTVELGSDPLAFVRLAEARGWHLVELHGLTEAEDGRFWATRRTRGSRTGQMILEKRWKAG